MYVCVCVYVYVLMVGSPKPTIVYIIIRNIWNTVSVVVNAVPIDDFNDGYGAVKIPLFCNAFRKDEESSSLPQTEERAMEQTVFKTQ